MAGEMHGALIGSEWRQRFRTVEAAAVAGIIAATGWSVVLGSTLHTIPGVHASDAEITKYYAGTINTLAGPAGIVLLCLASIGFLWFVGVIRDRVGSAAPQLFGTVFFASGILFVGIFFLGMSALIAPAVLAIRTERTVNPDMAAMMRAFASLLLGVIAPRMAAVFILSFSSLALRTGAVHRWVVIVSYIVGLVLLVFITVSTTPMYLFPAWVALVSVVLLFRPTPKADS